MVVEVDACSEVSQVLKKSGLACEDVGKAGACVGIGSPLAEIESDGAFESFVLINGKDEVAVDSVIVDHDTEVELECSGNGDIEIDAVDGKDSVLDQSEAEENLLTVPIAEGSRIDDKGDRHLENTTMASSIVLVGSVEINCKQAFPSFPLNNAAIKSFHFSLAAENLRLDIKGKSSPESTDCCLEGTEIEAKSESGIVDKESGSICLGNNQRSTDILSQLNEVENADSAWEEVKFIDDINLDLSIGIHSSSHDTAETQNVIAEVSGALYSVGIPRDEDEIKHAQSLVDEKTRIQDSFPYQIQTTQAACEEESLKLNQKETETGQSMINEEKDASSIDEIGIRINNMTHETLPLKEEKQLSHNIMKLALLLDQLSLDNASKQRELQLALEQHLKLLLLEMEQPVLNNYIKDDAAAENLVSPGLTMEQNKPIELLDVVATLPFDQESVSEEELEKRAEELMKEEEGIRLQEQLRLEEKAKAEIALARKKRKAERAEARAALRAQKEAEEKEKEKEKKSRKKKKKRKNKNKNPAAEDAENKADIEEEPQPAVSVETPTEIPETAEESKTTPTKSHKRPPSKKQKKAKPIIPPQLRKRGKRQMEKWVWILVSVIIVSVLFLLSLGNGDYLRKLGM